MKIYTSIVKDLFTRAEEYVLDHISLNCLRDWLIPRIQELYNTNDEAARELIGEIELGVIEINEGRLTEEELKRDIEALIFKKSIKILKDGPLEIESKSNPRIDDPNPRIY